MPNRFYITTAIAYANNQPGLHTLYEVIGADAIARWHREALITPIWEGPSNIQALDLLEAMEKKGAHLLFLEEVSALLEGHGEAEAALALETAEKTLAFLKGEKEAVWYAKEALRRLADALSVAVLLNLGEAYEPVARLYAHRFLKREEYPAWAGGWLLTQR
ncbi:MAG: hypothetical protein C4298_05475 [Thermus sp.]